MPEPPITLRAIHDSGPLAMPVTRIVIHATCPNVGFPAASAPGAALGTARYFQQAAAGGSAHYVEDPTTEAHCVPDNVTAWHAPPNGNSLGIEICAEGGDYPKSYTRAQWLSPQVWPAVQRAAARTRELCDRFGVPKTKIGAADLLAGAHGICGHVDVSQAWHQSTHSDPGPAFPWPEFLAEVNQGDDMANSDDILAYVKSIDARVRGTDRNVDSFTLLGMKVDAVVQLIIGGNTGGKNNFHWVVEQITAAIAAIPGAQVDQKALQEAIQQAISSSVTVSEETIAKAVADEEDRRARDGDPATGPVS